MNSVIENTPSDADVAKLIDEAKATVRDARVVATRDHRTTPWKTPERRARDRRRRRNKAQRQARKQQR